MQAGVSGKEMPKERRGNVYLRMSYLWKAFLKRKEMLLSAARIFDTMIREEPGDVMCVCVCVCVWVFRHKEK